VARVALAAAVLVLAAAVGAAARPARVRALDPAHLPPLPPAGLVVSRRGGVVLVGLDGRQVGLLAGFTTYGSSKLAPRAFARSLGFQALRDADPALPLLFDRRGRGWLLEPGARRLRALARPLEPLAGGAQLVVRVRGDDSSGYTTRLNVVRHGRVLVASTGLRVLASRYVAADADPSARGVLVDVVSGRRQLLDRRCKAAGVARGRVFVACESTNRKSPGRILSIAFGSAPVRIGSFSAALFVDNDSLSPDGLWLLADFSPGCGPGWAGVFSTLGGGTVHLVTGEPVAAGAALPRAHFSYALGWTSDDRVVTTIASPSGCEHESATGTYLIDPATLARTKITRLVASELWRAR
jgi:hypothetical protein